MGLIETIGKRTSNPYRLAAIDREVYSPEELMYSLVQSAQFLDEGILDEKLTEWIRTECGLPELVDLHVPGRKADPAAVCFVGTRDLDPGERDLMREAGVTVFSMSEIDRRGFPEVLGRVAAFFRERADAVHVSFDMDVLDPMFAPGTGIPLPAGLTNREALLLMEEMADTGLVRSAEIVEVNPVLDVRNQTAVLAVALAARLLGEKTW